MMINILALELNLSKFSKTCLKAFNGMEAIKLILDIYTNTVN